MPQPPIVVIGAGQAGLSVAYHLRRRDLRPGTDFTVLDRGPGTGGAWQHRWEALRLGDAHRVADLPGMGELGLSFDTAPTDRPAREVVADYYRRFEDHYDLRVRRPVSVEAVERDGAGFRLHAPEPGDPLLPRVVIAAVGTWGSPRIPAVPGRDEFRGRELATPEYVAAAEFAGRRVAVVGAGTSAIGFIRELAAADATTFWFTRRPVTFLEQDVTLREDLGRESVRRQDEAARAGRPLPSIVSTTGIPLAPRIRRLRDAGLLERRPMFTRMITDGVLEQDGRVVELDAVIWATGFDADLGPFAPLGIDARQGIRVERGHAVHVPGLFLAGYGPQASTISAERGARRIARDATRHLAGGAWPPR